MTTAIRTSKLVIDIPVPGAEPFIMGIMQKVIVDENDNVIQVIPRNEEWHRVASKIITNMCTFTDPVTQQTHTISGAGLDAAITAMVSQWIIEDAPSDWGCPAHLNENGRIILEE